MSRSHERREYMETLRIVIVEFHRRGGLTQYAGQLAEVLAARGHDVRLLTGARSELADRLKEAQLIPCLASFDPERPLATGRLAGGLQRLSRGVVIARAWRDVATYCAAHRPDVIQLGELRSAVDWTGVEWLALRRGNAVLVDICHNVLPFARRRDGPGYLRKGPLLKLLLLRAYRRMDAIVVHGASGRHRFQRSWKVDAPVAVMPMGDWRMFGDPLPPAEGPPTILFFGTWAPHKGLPDLLNAFDLVRARLPEARLEIVGSPTREVPEELVRASTSRFGMSVRLAPGYMNAAGVREAFRRATVVALPYREGFQSGVLHAALTLGRPVVGTRVGDLGDTISDARAGVVVEPGDPSALAQGLLDVLEDPRRARKMADAGGRWLRDASSWEIAAEHLERVYRAALQRARSGDGKRNP